MPSSDKTIISGRISVVIPCYKQGNLLPRALKSLAQQSYTDLEVIIVDDGSPEPVKLPENKWPFVLKLIRTENNGLPGARNNGIAHVTGQWIKFLDADDALLPDCLPLQMASLGDRNDAISVIGFTELDEDTGEKRDILPGFGDFGEALLQINIGPPHIFLYPTDTIREIGGFHTGERVNGGHEDYDLLLQLSAHGCHAVTVHKLGVIYYRRLGTMATFSEPMARTRAAVWSTHMLPIIRRSGIATNTVMAALSGWLNQMKMTPEKFQQPLEHAASELIFLLKEVDIHFPQSGLCAIHNLLQQNGTQKAKELLEVLPIPESQSIPLTWPPQALIDWRLGLQNRALKDSVTTWLVQSVNLLNGLDSPFAIYGAGELGKNLVGMLDCAGIKPVLLIDRDAKLGQRFNDIPIVTLDDVDADSFDYVFIASQRFKDEIERGLNEKMPQIEILEFEPETL